MAYVAVKGGERAIDAAHAWRAARRRGSRKRPLVTPDQVGDQLSRAVDRVMAEGSCYDPDLASRAILQAEGDLIEAAFLLRAFRATLPRFGTTAPVDTGAMQAERRVSAVFKDMPGGQVLGPTPDYTHRLLDPALPDVPPAPPEAEAGDQAMPPVFAILDKEGLIEPDPEPSGTPADLTREPLSFPAPRDARLQSLARGDEGFVLALGYSTQRGYGNNHPFVGELRAGTVAVHLHPPELPFPIDIGDLPLTECQMVNQFAGSRQAPPQFTRGYGLAFGRAERKAMGMALVDRALRAAELGEPADNPAQDAEFVLSHADSIEATGFVEHLKLPHYVDFQSELETIRRMRRDAEATPQDDPQDAPRDAPGRNAAE